MRSWPANGRRSCDDPSHGSALFVLLTALVVALVAPAPWRVAAPGDVDLEVTVTGVARGRVLSLAPAVDWTVTVTNSTLDSAITTTATGLTVRDMLAPGSPAPTTARAAPTVTTGTYDSVNGIWTIPTLAAGATATLTFRSEFPVLSTSANPTLSAQVVAQAQPDLDSTPAENADIGDEDDESLFNATTGANRTIGDQVWNDLNGDGRFAAPEPGVRSVPRPRHPSRRRHHLRRPDRQRRSVVLPPSGRGDRLGPVPGAGGQHVHRGQGRRRRR